VPSSPFQCSLGVQRSGRAAKMASLSKLNGRVAMSQLRFKVNREDGGVAIGPR